MLTQTQTTTFAETLTMPKHSGALPRTQTGSGTGVSQSIAFGTTNTQTLHKSDKTTNVIEK